MKKILLSALSLLALAGCDVQPKSYYPELENPQQKAFDAFLAKQDSVYNRLGNDIQREDFYQSFENDLQDYLDTISLFVNWQGVIKSIETRQIITSTELSFDVSYQPEEYREITFHCSYLVDKDSLSTDYLYNAVKTLSNHSRVYFDGYIRKNNNDEVVYSDYFESSLSIDGNRISRPKYRFNFVNISTESSAGLSADLLNAIDLDFKIIEPLKLHYLKEITQKESDKRYDDLLPQFNAAHSLLAEQERQYSQRLRFHLIDDIRYGDQ
jgi:hypothetical protein